MKFTLSLLHSLVVLNIAIQCLSEFEISVKKHELELSYELETQPCMMALLLIHMLNRPIKHTIQNF